MPLSSEQMKEYQARRRALQKEHVDPGHETQVDGCPGCKAREHTISQPPVEAAPIEGMVALDVRYDAAPRVRRRSQLEPVVVPDHWTPDALPSEPRYWVEPPVRPASGPWSSGHPWYGRPIERTPYVPSKNDLIRDQAIEENRRRIRQARASLPPSK